MNSHQDIIHFHKWLLGSRKGTVFTELKLPCLWSAEIRIHNQLVKDANEKQMIVVRDGLFVGFIYLEVITSSAYYIIRTQYMFLSRQVVGIRWLTSSQGNTPVKCDVQEDDKVNSLDTKPWSQSSRFILNSSTSLCISLWVQWTRK